MSPAILGSNVPRQANGCRASNFSDGFFSSSSSSSSGKGARSTTFPSGRAALGAVVPSTVQSLLTSASTSGYFFRSAGVGSQVRPRGGPNSAQLSRFSAMREVVNLASHDGKAASGGSEN